MVPIYIFKASLGYSLSHSIFTDLEANPFKLIVLNKAGAMMSIVRKKTNNLRAMIQVNVIIDCRDTYLSSFVSKGKG
ncbi:hypothetical protein FIU95_11385 [Microbulbifer sp. THAF38]|nr:hypothetical protein FIU95_11385 [Microbulbifer sp. THAF38]